MKGALRRTFGDGFEIVIFSFTSRLTHLFTLDNYYTLWSLQRVQSFVIPACPESFRKNSDTHFLRNRTYDSAPNGILVAPEYVTDSRTYDSIDFAGISAKVEIFGIIKKTTQLLAMACILLN